MTTVTILGAFFLVIIFFVAPYSSTLAARSGIKDDDPYKVLGVKRTASVDDVQRAYRLRARETHRKCTRCLL
jgi:preprotein translocase subunit Sec63